MSYELKLVYEIDVCYEDFDSLEDAVLNLVDGTSIRWEVLELQGPGGGWPVVRFECNDDNDVRTFRRRYDPYNDTAIFDEIG